MKKYVKCIVCGEILEEGVSKCPVCGVDSSNFVPYEPPDNDAKARYVIVGNGIAAVTAAEEIRRWDGEGHITALSLEGCPAYIRPLLTKKPINEIELNSVILHPDEWYKENGIELELDGEVVDICPRSREISLASGRKLKYTKCIYAAGASPFMPPIEGIDRDNVTGLRTLKDVGVIKELAKKAKSAVVIGGGVLGLEAAWSLRSMGLDVTVIEIADSVLANRISPQDAQSLLSAAKEKGVEVMLGSKVEKITDNGVKIEGGGIIIADMVIVSSGIRTNHGVLKNAGADCGRGVKVNKRMETSLPDIYACGDCAEPEGYAVRGLWNEAQEMGRIAGINAAGGNAEFTGYSGAMTVSAFGLTLLADENGVKIQAAAQV